jgi:hypothetical protein
LIDSENNTAYKFDLNSSLPDLDVEEDFTEYKTNNVYNSYSRGNTNIFKGTVRAIIKNEDSVTFEQTNEQLAALREFVLSNRTKYLKDKRNRIWKVVTWGYKESQVEEAVESQPRYCEFNFAESGSVF